MCIGAQNWSEKGDIKGDSLTMSRDFDREWALSLLSEYSNYIITNYFNIKVNFFTQPDVRLLTGIEMIRVFLQTTKTFSAQILTWRFMPLSIDPLPDIVS